MDENDACHAGLMDANRVYTKGSLLTIISGFQQQNMEAAEEEQRMFIKYMLEDSPWSKCFLIESVDDVLENHWLLNVNEPANLMSGAAIATRLISEFPQNFRAWVKMVEVGVDPNKAMLFAQLARYSERGGLYVSTWPGHTPINGSYTKEYFDNFISKTPKIVMAPYNEVLTYNNISRTWGKEGNVNYHKFKTIRPREKVISQNLNIFFRRFKEMRDRGYHYFKTMEEIRNFAEDAECLINQS
jgi:hypothetical protein